MPSKFLSRRLLLAIHRDQLVQHGGRSGVRDDTLLDSALQQPRATFGNKLLHPTVPDQAAAYLFHLARNHPFIDGNKRVALAAMDTFLRVNNNHLDLDDDALYELVIRVAEGTLDKDELARVVRENTRIS